MTIFSLVNPVMENVAKIFSKAGCYFGATTICNWANMFLQEN